MPRLFYINFFVRACEIRWFLTNLYINESSIAEDINNRIEALKYADSMTDELNKIDDHGEDIEMDGYDEPEEFDPSAGVI